MTRHVSTPRKGGLGDDIKLAKESPEGRVRKDVRVSEREGKKEERVMQVG